MVKDGEDSLLVDMPSKTTKVNPSDDLLEEIYSLTNVQPMLR
jgi:DNA polymerase-3 subunit alpha